MRRIVRALGAGAVALVFGACGNLSPLAGTGASGASGDGGAAQAARLNQPNDVALGSGSFCDGGPGPCPNLYIADTGNNRVRRVGGGAVSPTGIPTGTIETFLTGLSGPRGVAVSQADSGILMVSDTGRNRVLRVNVADRTFIVVAGGGFSAGPCATRMKLVQPTGIDTDSAGNLYVAEAGSHVIRKVFGVAGATPPPECSNATAVVGDPGTAQVVAGKVGAASFTDNVDADTLGRLHGPRDVDEFAGMLFIADTENNRVRFVGTDGVIHTMSGTGPAGFNGDCGPAHLAQLDRPWSVAAVAPVFGGSFPTVYISDTGNGRLRRIDSDGPIPNSIFTVVRDYQVPIGGPATLPVRLRAPRGIAVDRQILPIPPVGVPGDGIVIADTNNNMVGGIAFDFAVDFCGLVP